MMKQKGQSMVEYLMVVAVALLVLVPTVMFFTSHTNAISREGAAAKLDAIGSSVVELVDSVYILGEDSKTTLTINLPDYVQNITYINYTDSPYPLSNDLVLEVGQGIYNTELLFVSTYPFFIGNCTDGAQSLPDTFIKNPGRKEFKLTSCGGAVAIWYQ